MSNTLQRGFTLVEIMTVTVLLGIILIMSYQASRSSQYKIPQGSDLDRIMADLRYAQASAMSGDNGGDTTGKPGAYGIHFDAEKYVLFKDTYNANCNLDYGYVPANYTPDPTPGPSGCTSRNIVTYLEGSRVTTFNLGSVTGNEVIFAPVTGEPSTGYNSTYKSITVTSFDGTSTKVVEINRLGVPTRR